MKLQNRIENLILLGKNLLENEENLQIAKENAYYNNAWFIPEFIDLACNKIATNFLQKDILESFASTYNLSEENLQPKQVGIVMAGNIPMVGFHDLLCVYLSGNKAICKLAEKDTVLMQYVINFLNNVDGGNNIQTAEMLKGCDAYIATGSNNSARYFEQYFSKYANIIRQSKTSVAVLSGTESQNDLENLALDILSYFGLGCRSITKLYVPENYNFENLVAALKSNSLTHNHNKYKNNFDYNLALYLLNNQYYMTDGKILLVESEQLFSPIAVIHYAYHSDIKTVQIELENNTDIQAIVGNKYLPFGSSQEPSISNYADGVDTMQFLVSL